MYDWPHLREGGKEIEGEGGRGGEVLMEGRGLGMGGDG